MSDPDHERLTELANELSLDPNAIEDAVARGERPKATRYAGHAFVTAYATWFDAEDAVTLGVLDSRLRLSRVSAFVLSNGIITVRRDDRFDMSQVVERWEEDPALLTPGSGALALLHGLLDAIVDGQFETIETIDDAIEALEEGLFDESARTKEIQQRTYRLRKELVQLRRVVLPMREVVGGHHRGPHRGDGVVRSERPVPRGRAGGGDDRQHRRDRDVREPALRPVPPARLALTDLEFTRLRHGQQHPEVVGDHTGRDGGIDGALNAQSDTETEDAAGRVLHGDGQGDPQ